MQSALTRSYVGSTPTPAAKRTDMTDEQAEQLLIAAQSIARSLELIAATVEMQTVNEACAEEIPDALRTLDSR